MAKKVLKAKRVHGLTPEQTRAAQKALAKLSELEVDKRPVDKHGRLDIKRFNELPEVERLKKALLKLKINKAMLDRSGFVIASMVLTGF